MSLNPFIANAALMLTLTLLSVHFRYLWLKTFKLKDGLIGILYGFFAILAMSAPVTLTEGAIFDGRSIIMGLAAFFEPPLVVLIAAVMGSAYRIYLGGIGTLTGVGSIILSGAIGLLFRAIARKKNCKTTFLNLLILGLSIHGVLLLWFFSLPRSIAIETIKTIALPYVGTFSLTTMLIGLFINAQQERALSEQKLAQSESKYRALVETLQEGIWMVNTRAETSFVNPSMARMVGYEEHEMVGTLLLDFIAPEERENISQSLERRKQGISEHYETVLLHKSGRRVAILVEASPVYDDEGNYMGSLAGVQDISDRIRAEMELEKYSKNLESMVEERTRALRDAQGQLIAVEKMATLGEMAASVGHELRNPLSVIRNAVYLLKAQNHADEKTAGYIDLIDTEIRSVSQIVTDLLDYSRIHPMKSDLLEIRALVEQALRSETIPGKVRVKTRIAQPLPKVVCNRQQVTQILANLIRNALEAMPQGGELLVSSELIANQPTISIHDTGAGILKENLEKIFEPLYTTKARGVGLGLTISRRLAEINEARITVESRKNRGSTFTLWLKSA